jgi:DNA-binding transcriptional ArsR family regulator
MAKKSKRAGHAKRAARTEEEERSLTQAVQLFGLLGDPTRLAILLLLEQVGERTVKELTHALGIRHPALSFHLKFLRLGRLISQRKAGRYQYCRLDNPALGEFLRAAYGLAEKDESEQCTLTAASRCPSLSSKEALENDQLSRHRPGASKRE